MKPVGIYAVEEMAGDEGRASVRRVASGLTKREAAAVVAVNRKPKTSVLKVGHTYRYWRRKR